MDINDYIAIQNLLHRYCDTIDRGNFDATGAMFAHADVYMSALAPFRSDPAAVAQSYRQYTKLFPETGTPRTRHVVTNLIMEQEGPDSVRTQSYIVVFQATPSLPFQPIIGGRYLDRFARVDGVWRFAERRMDIDMFGNLSDHMLLPFGPDSAPPT